MLDVRPRRPGLALRPGPDTLFPMARMTPLRPRPAAGLRRAGALLLSALAGCGGEATEPSDAASGATSALAGAARATEPARLRVMLLALEDGAPLAGLPVFVWPRSGAEAPRKALEASEAGLGEIPLTGAGGAATFHLPPGRYSAAAEWPAQEPLLVDLKP